MGKNLWKATEWEQYIDYNSVRHGIRIRFDKEIDEELVWVIKVFINWMRKKYVFPIRVPIYIKNKPYITTLDGDLATATFFEPYDYNVEPYIRIAVGNYKNDIQKFGKERAIGGILGSIAHEMTHYYQWINHIEKEDSKMELQAIYYKRRICIMFVSEQGLFD